MTYHGEGEVSAVFLPKDEVETLQLGPTTARFTATGSLTSERFGLYRWDMGPGAGGASPHFHRTFSESFYVLSGNVRLYNGNEWVIASPGDFIYVPEGGVHGFGTEAGEAASMLILFSPAPPREPYFRELAEIAASGRQLSEEEWIELWTRYDQFPVK
jgi:quercetin dioxygenase-like cupin family protein